jgi:hypothetical protein
MARSVIRPTRRFILASSCAISGHQHTLLQHSWARAKKAGRDAAFSATGFENFQLLPVPQWQALAAAVDEQMTLAGIRRKTNADWADDRRISLDVSKEPIAALVRQVHDSPGLRAQMDKVLGGAKWSIFETQIWRNYPEEYGIPGKEVNSTFYHVDNGGGFKHRLVLNIFLYLTHVTPENGPFTYYSAPETVRINQHFLGEIFQRGNLRTHELVQKIEDFIPARQLMLKPGEACVIDNQVCLHRAGYCTAGHRDILQLLVRPD